jgi:hypothetical protein
MRFCERLHGGVGVTMTALLATTGCLHSASAVIPTLGLLSNKADRVTSQISLSGVTARGSTATDGTVLSGGYGGRLRMIRKGPFSPFSRPGDSRTTKSPLLFSSRIEAGSWGDRNRYYSR